jgi:hypothetical protein
MYEFDNRKIAEIRLSYYYLGAVLRQKSSSSWQELKPRRPAASTSSVLALKQA